MNLVLGPPSYIWKVLVQMSLSLISFMDKSVYYKYSDLKGLESEELCDMMIDTLWDRLPYWQETIFIKVYISKILSVFKSLLWCLSVHSYFLLSVLQDTGISPPNVLCLPTLPLMADSCCLLFKSGLCIRSGKSTLKYQLC